MWTFLFGINGKVLKLNTRTIYKLVRDQLHSKAILTNNIADWDNYKKMKNKVTSMVRDAKREYYYSSIEENKGDHRGMWRVLKGLLPKCSQSSITSLLINEVLVTNFRQIAQEFNKFFIDIGENLSKRIPSSGKTALSYLIEHLPHPPGHFRFTRISEMDVTRLLADLPRDKATGLDNIQAQLLKIASPAIANSLAYILNSSLRLGAVPNEWKHARIAAIHKKGPRTDPGNYRPISILPVVSKLLERIVHTQLYQYCIDHNILCLEQSGFRPKHSTQTSLHRLTEFIFNELHQGKITGMVALDLKKAFDTVNHEILLNKLAHYGITDNNLLWFRNYLTNRKQIASINGNLSESLLITTGVPQGSILGPLLFILYVNDLNSCFKKSIVNMYADDTVFYCSASSVASVTQNLQCDLQTVANWLQANKLSLHIGKTNCMIICNNKKKEFLDNPILDLSLDGKNITQATDCKYLGVTLDSQMKFKIHVNDVINKMKRALGIFTRAAQFVDPSTRITLYNTLILPHLDYCSTVWCGSLNKSDLMRLQRIQNRAMRAILHCHPRTHILDLLRTLKWMSIKQRLHYNLCTFIWKIIHDQVPIYLSDIYTPVANIHNHNTRFSNNSSLFRRRTSHKSLSTLGAKIWNELPQHVRDARSLYSFKKGCVLHIFDTIAPLQL